MRWKLADCLEQHDLNAHQLMQRSGLSHNTVYPMARGEAQRVDLKTLETVIVTLREMTGEQIEVGDLLELEDEREAGAPWEVLVGLLEHPAFDERSVETMNDDLATSLERELNRA